MSYYSLISIMPKAAAYDPDAQAFFTASGLTGTTNLNAINQLVLDLKSYGIWTKMKAIYPFVGGTAALHKWNLKNPLDTNAAFRLTFNGGWTHSSTGATPNGTNGYADTFLVPSTAYPNSNSGHLSIYMRTNTNIASVDIGCAFVSLGINRYNLLSIRRSDVSGTTFYMNFAFQGLWASFVDTNSAAFYIGTRNTGTINGFRNTVKVATINTAPDLLIPHNTILGAYSLNGALQPGLYSNREYAFASIGDGLTDTEAANFYTAVQAYQTTLSRQV